MTHRPLAWVTLVLLASVMACGGDVAGESATAVEDPALAVTQRNLAYATWGERTLTLDLHAPAESGDAPIVIYLPGRNESSAPPSIVDSLVEDGSIVFVVRYAKSGSGPEQLLADHGADIRAQAESVACAIHFAREQASQPGSTDPVVVLTGFSNGAGLGAHAALFGASLEARWDEYAAEGGPDGQVECEVTEGSTEVDALVGMGGNYDVFVPAYDGKWGSAYQQEHDRALWQFLASPIGASPDLTIRLIHGTTDGLIPVENSAEFATMLTDAGYDVGEVATFAGGHVPPPAELSLSTIMEVIGP